MIGPVLYEKYMELYKLAIDDLVPTEDGILKSGNSYVIQPEIWITIKYLEDNACNPWDWKFKELIKELEIKGEQAMLLAITTTLKIFEERVSAK